MTRSPRRRGRVMVAASGALVATAAASARPGAAQEPSSTAQDLLLLPQSARIAGLGGAGVASSLGSESALVNPAGLAVAPRRDLALYYAQDIRGERTVLAAVVPSRRLGAFGASAALANIVESPALDELGNQTGTFFVRTVYANASYASTLGRRLALGVTYRVWQFRVDCSGLCSRPGETPFSNATASMVDLGAQYDVGRRSPIVIGAALRNLGPRVQFRDEDQTDALPTQLVVGARAELPGIARRVPGAELRVLGELSRGVSGTGALTALSVAAEGTYQRVFALRAGWTQRTGEESGPSVGFTYELRRLGFDVARQLTGFSVESGQPPTYVGLRYRF